ncbi:hypothetical protein F383_32675 [Gossypium arboreum]|uniref:Uncharacterized protein n=1 Tax=Gossypium arboreum TaxID=29729 RepID=A0A0B0PP17_GOSAR|nr:hypothetical protein F383_32675 [Gossypium arboreum]
MIFGLMPLTFISNKRSRASFNNPSLQTVKDGTICYNIGSKPLPFISLRNPTVLSVLPLLHNP